MGMSKKDNDAVKQERQDLADEIKNATGKDLDS